ncbi:MFS transporter [Undibacterium flavidum]|uniref:MFS transporter n=1 Tax=Undibacterium flavidum TaxID=2762297 RepID=A0ABR6YG29_9BURK|nr:MFS transporter [Undibacterium flavidum]MBC3875463.1 MFS transporter [Undibacterium flavidum]
MKAAPLIFYGLLGLPLAMAALPVYVQIPNYYTAQLGLPLASTGLVLFFARLFDTVQDPFIGQLIDRFGCSNRLWLIVSAFLLCLAFTGLWLPPDSVRDSPSTLLIWLGVMLSLAYTAHSMLNIAYLSWGSSFDTQSAQQDTVYHQLLGASAWREAFGLVGVILASIVPSWIILHDSNSQHSSLNQSLSLSLNLSHQLTQYAALFTFLVVVGIAALLLGATKPFKRTQHQQATHYKSIALRALLANKAFVQLLAVYFFNSLSVAIPASLILFFINDRIQAPEKTALFLASYFVAGACGLPLWMKLAKHVGAQRAWQLGMVIAVLSFVGASLLGAGDTNAFWVLCIASGFALGADLALPPVLLTQVVEDKQSIGAYFGLWSLIGKFTLALAGLSLSLLALLGYQPDYANQASQTIHSIQHSIQSTGLLALSFTYAALPCAFKLIALFLLRNFSKRFPS